MIGHTRRDFLRRTAVAGGAAALSQLGVEGFAQEAAQAQMCIARWKGEPGSYPDEMKALATKLTERAIAELGGMKRFVSKGDVVWIKPNIAWDRSPEQAANTNPDVVATLTRLCLDAGAKRVKVGDNTCNDKKKTYPNSGIQAAAKAAGDEVLLVDESRFKDVAINGERLKTWPLYPEIIECDLVINVPIVKDHSLTKATLCMKNYMGVAGGERGKWHQDMNTCLCDITAYMKPRLSVLDGIRILTRRGPTGGNLDDVKRMDTLAAGTDVLALDAFGAELMGLTPQDMKTVVAGQERGLGQMDYRKLALREVEVA